MNNSFDWKDFLKRVAVIAVPIAVQNLLTTTGSMMDTMMIGSLGERHIAAVGLCAQFSTLMFSCYWGFVGGGMLFFGQYWGSKDDKGINRSYGLTISCMLFVSLIFAIAAIFLPSLVMRIYTDKVGIQEIGVAYLRIVGFAYPLQVLSMGMSALLRSTERVRIPLLASIASVSTNIFLNWVFIFGHLGAPKMGVPGAALATTIAAVVNTLVIVLLAKSIHYPYIFQFRQHFKWNKDFIRLYVQKCFPIICNELFLGIANMVINIVLGHQAEEAIAALAVFRTLEGLIIGFFAGFSNAASVLVGKNVGAGNLDVAYERGWRLIYLCQGIIACLVVTIIGIRWPLLHLLGLSDQSYYYGTGLIIIYGIFCIIRMGNWTMNDTYRSAGDATTGTVLEIVFMYAMIVPMLLLGWLKFQLPFLVLFSFCYLDEPVRYIIMQRHMFSGKWVRPVTEEGKAKLEEFLLKHKSGKRLRVR